jgi:hypothetical protein
MRKVLFAAAVGVLTIVSVSTAQMFEFDIEGGYGLGAGSDFVGKNIEQDASFATVKYEEVYASRGKGLKIKAAFVFYPLENIGIMASSGYSAGGGFEVGEDDPGYANKETSKAGYIPVNIGLKLKAKKIGMVVPYVYCAPGIYFPTESYTQVINSQEYSKRTYTYEMGFGFTGGVGASFMLADNIGLNVEISPTYAFANVKQYEEEISGLKVTYIYKPNTPDDQFPPSSTETVYLHDQPRNSFSSVAARAGVSIGF